MNTPRISIISVNYRNTPDTLAFLASVRQLDDADLEVILVDNAPLEDDSVKFQEAYPSLIYVYSQKNIGFAGANNLGIQHASGALFYFLNNDTIVNEESIWPLVSAFETDEKLGAASPRITYFDQPEIIQYAGFSPMNFWTGRNKAVRKGEVDHTNARRTQSTGYPHGAAMMLRRETVDAVGTMEESYFLYYEELDWGERMYRAGWHIQLIGTAHIIHKASVSTGKGSPLQTYYHTRNRMTFVYRFGNILQKTVFTLYFTLLVMPQKLIAFLLEGELNHASALLNGLKNAIGLPHKDEFSKPTI